MLEGCLLITLTSDGFNISIYTVINCSCVLCSEQLLVVVGNLRWWLNPELQANCSANKLRNCPPTSGLNDTISHTDTQSLSPMNKAQHTTNRRDVHPCPQRDSNPRSRQSNGRRPTTVPRDGQYADIIAHYAVTACLPSDKHVCNTIILLIEM